MIEAIKNFRINIDKKEVCRYLGYHNGRRPTSSISSLIDKEIEESYGLIRPVGFYRILEIVRIRRPHIILDNGLMITSKVSSQILSDCLQVAIFVVTIGGNLEEKAAKLMGEGRMLKATVLDAIGSEAADKTACYLHEKIREPANSNGTEVTLRFSPGYCDWDISQQKVLFEAMSSAPLGVALTEGCLMIPRKSISGLFGIGETTKSQLRLSPCRFCAKTECLSRR